MDSPGEILNLCRLCLVKDQVNIPIFEEQGDIRQIFLKISSCLPVTITRHDQLPKRICDACSNKLDLLYEFWNSSASAEKTLLSWLGQAGVEDAGEKISAVAQQIAKPAETLVKEESEALDESNLINESRDSFEDQSIDDEGTKDEAEAPPPKRARRTAAVKAQINITPESDEDEDDDFDAGEAMTKMEDESEESESDMKDDPSYSELPGTSADDQAGPSGVGKDGVEAPYPDVSRDMFDVEVKEDIEFEEHELSQMVKLEKDASDETLILKVEDNLENPENMQKLNTNSTEELEAYKCNVCPETFVLVADFNAHLLKHSEDRSLECVICGLKLKRKVSLKTHIRKHTQGRQYHCKICNKAFLSSRNLSQHGNTHSDNRPYVCNICNLRFKRNRNLVEHQNKHSKEKQYDCKICQRQFIHSSSLTYHLKTHSDDRPHVCDFCSLTFKQKSHLNAHRNKHTKDKEYTCNICNRTFFYSQALTQHMKTHSDIYPFKCTICNANFKAKHHLTRHSQFVHNTKIEKGKREGKNDTKKTLMKV